LQLLQDAGKYRSACGYAEFMNIFLESQEVIVDLLFPIFNAPVSQKVNFWIHVVIVTIEMWAFIAVYRIARR